MRQRTVRTANTVQSFGRTGYTKKNWLRQRIHGEIPGIGCTCGKSDEIQQVNIFTAGLLEPLKTDVELLNPQDMETAMSLARSYERRMTVMANANKSPATKQGRFPTPRPSATTTTTTAAAATPVTPQTVETQPPQRTFKRLTADEMATRRQAGLCFNCDEPFSRGHKCKNLFEITVINDYNADDVGESMMMMIGKPHSGVHRASPMYLEAMINGTRVIALVDSGSTRNVIDINVARAIALNKQRIDTTILVGSGNEVTCHCASFNVPLRIASDIFEINAFLLGIGNDIDVILGAPWLASLGRITWDFSNLELRYTSNGWLHTLTAIRQHRVQSTVQALPAPPPMVQTNSENRSTDNPMNRSNRARLPNATDFIKNSEAAIFSHIRHAVERQHELRRMQNAIKAGLESPNWSVERGLIFYDGRLYLPAASTILQDLIQELTKDELQQIELLAMGIYDTPVEGNSTIERS